MIKSSVSNKIPILQVIAVIVAMTFAIRASNNMLQTTIPLFAKYNFFFSQSVIGILTALMPLSTFVITAMVNAKLSAERRRVLFISCNVGFALILVLFYFADSVTLWILTIASGLVLGSIMPNIITAASLFEDQKMRERVVSLYSIALSVSLIVGPSIESLILTTYSLKEVFPLFAPFGILSSVLSLFLKFPVEERESAAARVWPEAGFRLAVYSILAYHVPFSLLVAFGGIYARNAFGVSFSLVTLLFALFFISSLLSRAFLSIRPAENLYRHIIFAMLLTMAGLAGMLLSENIFVYAVSLVVLGIPHGITYPLALVAISRSYSDSVRNAANSYFYAIMMIIGVITPLIGGVMADYLGLALTFGALIPVILGLMVLTSLTVRTSKSRGTLLSRTSILQKPSEN